MNNDELVIGKKYEIHSYKHDGSIHRSWDEAVLLEINSNYLVFRNNRTKVTEFDGRTWRTKEPAILYFYKDKWYNVIGQKKKDGIYYYCNIATPYILEENTVKFIDYDLDLRVYADGSFKVLDRGEYKYHQKLMNYPEKLDKILKDELTNLIELSKSKKDGFNNEEIKKQFAAYERLKKKN